MPRSRSLSLALCFLLGCAAGTAPAADDEALPPEQLAHWAWRPPVRSAPPTVRDVAWVRNPIDAFLLASLEAADLRPAPPAPPEILLRRATLDLTGLPPTPAEVDAFLADPSPSAWERVVERLLASPHYGGRWGRHWLDLARYAESNGFEFDEPRPDAWRFRDYVIDALNADLPYDRFLAEQLAGDELAPDDPRALIATGFNLLGPDMTDASDMVKRRHDRLNDVTDTAALVFLGLTLGCARCHDHKFEPMPQADYFRFQAFFTPAAFRNDLPVVPPAERAAHQAALRTHEELTRPTRERLAHLEEPYRRRLAEARRAKLADEARVAHETPSERRTAAQRELVEKTTRLITVRPEEVAKALTPADRTRHNELLDELKRFDSRKPVPLPLALGLQDTLPAPPTFVLERGLLSQRGAPVQPGFPVVLTPGHQPLSATVTPPRPGTSGRRAALAAWLTQPDHPLTARVLVNRLWHHHFGRGLVATPSDFGLRGARPSHPELLDWLAVEFRERGWSIKAMHRLLLTSSAYRQSTRATPEAEEYDLENRLFGRMGRRRLDAEEVRDGLLALSGRLNLRMGGPGVRLPEFAEAGGSKNALPSTRDPAERSRRSVYLFARRNLRLPFLEAFDLPDTNLSCARRERSTTAPQALALLNAPEAAIAAHALAERLGRETASLEDAIVLAFRLTLGRRPSAEELRRCREFLADSPLTELCRALVNVNEFVHVD